MCGLGQVGKVVTNNCLRGGHEVFVYDVDSKAVSNICAQHPEAQQVSTNADLAEKSEVVLTCLPRPEHVNAAMEGPSGILEGLQKGSTWIEHSTTDF